jgi:integrase
MLAEVSGGGDPSRTRQDDRKSPTFREFAERYMLEHSLKRKKPNSVATDRRLLDNHILSALGAKKIQAIDRKDIRALHQGMAAIPYAANRAMTLLAHLFTMAEKWGVRPDGTNPCRHVERFPEEKRERYLTPDEINRLSEVLAKAEQEQTEPAAVVLALRLLLLTGCRMGEILTLQWAFLDMDKGVLNLPDSKTGKKTVYLSAPALAVLAAAERLPGNAYVVPGRKPGACLVNLEKPWRRVRARAGLESVRLHDLRHTFASMGAAAGLSLPMIGKLLGHTQVQTTARYAHLAADPMMQAANTIGHTIAGAMQGKPKAEVVPLRRGEK